MSYFWTKWRADRQVQFKMRSLQDGKELLMVPQRVREQASPADSQASLPHGGLGLAP